MQTQLDPIPEAIAARAREIWPDAHEYRIREAATTGVDVTWWFDDYNRCRLCGKQMTQNIWASGASLISHLNAHTRRGELAKGRNLYSYTLPLSPEGVAL